MSLLLPPFLQGETGAIWAWTVNTADIQEESLDQKCCFTWGWECTRPPVYLRHLGPERCRLECLAASRSPPLYKFNGMHYLRYRVNEHLLWSVASLHQNTINSTIINRYYKVERLLEAVCIADWYLTTEGVTHHKWWLNCCTSEYFKMNTLIESYCDQISLEPSVCFHNLPGDFPPVPLSIIQQAARVCHGWWCHFWLDWLCWKNWTHTHPDTWKSLIKAFIIMEWVNTWTLETAKVPKCVKLPVRNFFESTCMIEIQKVSKLI